MTSFCFVLRDLDTIIATCGEDGIRLWDLNNGKQLLHIPEDGCVVAECMKFSADGKLILSGWSDGCIRAHTPETGKMIFVAQGVHPSGVSAMCTLSLGNHTHGLLTGGKNGQMRSWRMPSIYSMQQKVIGKPSLLMTVKEHTAEIVKIHVTKDQKECVTASKDGTCIIWDIQRYTSFIPFSNLTKKETKLFFLVGVTRFGIFALLVWNPFIEDKYYMQPGL